MQGGRMHCGIGSTRNMDKQPTPPCIFPRADDTMQLQHPHQRHAQGVSFFKKDLEFGPGLGRVLLLEGDHCRAVPCVLCVRACVHARKHAKHTCTHAKPARRHERHGISRTAQHGRTDERTHARSLAHRHAGMHAWHRLDLRGQ